MLSLRCLRPLNNQQQRVKIIHFHAPIAHFSTAKDTEDLELKSLLQVTYFSLKSEPLLKYYDVSLSTNDFKRLSSYNLEIVGPAETSNSCG